MMVNTSQVSQRPVTMTTRFLAFAVICVVWISSIDNATSHSIQKRFFWKGLAQLAQPFIRPKPKPMNYQPMYAPPHPAPPVYQVSPTVPQPMHAPPSSGQLYIPLPGTGYPNNNNNNPPIYVPPSSFGSNNQVYPPSNNAQWKPMEPPMIGRPIYYDQLGGAVGPPGIPFQAQPGGVMDALPPHLDSGVSVSELLLNPFKGSNVFLTGSDKSAPAGFLKVPLPNSVLRSIVDIGLDAPTIYLASSSIAPSQEFALLEVNGETVESLRAAALQPNSSRAAELPSPIAEDLVAAIKSAAPRLVGNNTSLDDIGDLITTGGFSLSDLTTDLTKDSETETEEPIETSPLDLEPEVSSDMSTPAELPTVFLARRNADVPADYVRVLLPDDIVKELRRRVTPQTLRAQGVSRLDLTETYLAPSTSGAVKPPLGLVPVHLAKEALMILDEYIKEAEKLVNDKTPQLELPRSVLEQLSQDTSQHVRLIDGSRETAIKTGSTDVFIAPSDKKPPDGYVSIPLTEGAMSELKKNFLGSSVRSQDISKGIPVIAYVAPANKKLPAGHVAVPLPDSVLESVQSSTSSVSDVTINGRVASKPEKNVPLKENSALLRDSDSAVFLAASHKLAPFSFKKLKLPETIMDDLRSAIPAEKLAEAGTPSKDLTAAYLASTNEFIPPGFLSISVPDSLVKMLEIFADTRESKDDNDENSDDTTASTSNKNKSQGSRDGGGEDGKNLPHKMLDALVDAIRRTLTDIFRNSRIDGRKNRNRGGSGSRGSGNRGSGSRGSGSGSRDNARITTSDADENEFNKDDADDDVNSYQPGYQISPFSPGGMSGYSYVNPYQYGSLWTYADGNPWTADGSSYYGDYGVQAPAQDRDATYYYDGGVDGIDAVDGTQYVVGQPQYEIAAIKKRHGESSSEGGR